MRGSGLRAVQEALKIDRGIKPLLKMTRDPKDPAKSPGGDDLDLFFDDPEFKALFG